MDGTSVDLIVIPIVTVISLAAWLIAVAYAAVHPQWKSQRPTPAPSVPRPADPPDDQLPARSRPTADQPEGTPGPARSPRL